MSSNRSERDALRILAAVHDEALLGEIDCNDLYERKLLRLVRDCADEYQTIPTREGRDLVRSALGSTARREKTPEELDQEEEYRDA